jgi:hypothetical protein
MMSLVLIALRIIGVAIGVTLIGVGLPLFFMPIPLGLIFIALGILVLIVSSAQAAAAVRGLRRRNPRFDSRLRKVEDAMPGFLSRILAVTRPSG